MGSRLFLAILAAPLVLGIGAAPAAADAVFIAPPEVQADGAGEFSYVAVLTAGDGCVGWAGYGYQGSENVDAMLYVDTFCIDPQPVPAGQYVVFTVTGRLVDPHLGGSVLAESSFCTGGGGFMTTTVRAPAVPDAPVGWSGAKARYR